MADTPHRPGPTPPVTSRRSFLRASALTAGAAALPLAACGPTNSASAADGRGRDHGAAITGGHWVEPTEWNVADHPDTPLQLRVEEVVAPAWLHINGPSGGSASAPAGPTSLFTYNGQIPGPTIRTRGNSTVRVQLINALSGNDSNWAHRSGSRFAKPATIGDTTYDADTIVPDTEDWKLSRHLIYGPHMQHTTNLHTHGLHVAPGPNADGTQSDNVMLRVIPRQDAVDRLAATPPIPLSTGGPGDPQHVEVTGPVDYEFRIGSDARSAAGGAVPTHPPGTHWYHPHPHGATYDQVVSGMAGFLIVEGDVDDALRDALSDPAYRYRERLMLLQRVFDTGTAPIGEEEGGTLGNRLNKNQKAVNTVNGQPAGNLSFVMDAGTVERWRVLNGSVDGQGYVRFCMVPGTAPAPPTEASNPDKSEDVNRAYDQSLADWAAQYGVSMWHLAFDGVTLVSESGVYSPRAVTSVELAPANRSDFLVQAPQTAGTYQIWGLGVTERAGDPAAPPLPIATVIVNGGDGPDELPRGFFDGVLAGVPVPDELLPVTDADLAVPGGIRSRQVVFSGWGGSYACDGTETPIDNGTGTNSMAISRLKYDPMKPVQTMGLGTAEEWVLDNYSVGHPLSNNGAVAHPFHMHQNPFWVLAVYDPVWTDGALSYAPRPGYPRWQDVVPVPVNGGRVVMRSRFPDFAGFFVNHCHILQHEDWGMMQAVEIMTDVADANPATNPAPYNVQDPITNPTYALPTEALMEQYCRVFFADDGTIGPGGVVSGATPIWFCPGTPTPPDIGPPQDSTGTAQSA